MLSHPASSPGGSSGEQHTAIVPIRIYYEDTDAGGLVHHSNYLRYFERGREHVLGCAKLTELFEAQLALQQAQMRSDGIDEPAPVPEKIYPEGAIVFPPNAAQD